MSFRDRYGRGPQEREVCEKIQRGEIEPRWVYPEILCARIDDGIMEQYTEWLEVQEPSRLVEISREEVRSLLDRAGELEAAWVWQAKSRRLRVRWERKHRRGP